MRRETARGYLKAAGVEMRAVVDLPRIRQNRPYRRMGPPTRRRSSLAGTGAGDAASVSDDGLGRVSRASACEPYRDLILSRIPRFYVNVDSRSTVQCPGTAFPSSRRSASRLMSESLAGR